MCDEERWAQQKEWDTEKEEPELTKEDYEADEADRKHHEQGTRRRNNDYGSLDRVYGSRMEVSNDKCDRNRIGWVNLCSFSMLVDIHRITKGEG